MIVKFYDQFNKFALKLQAQMYAKDHYFYNILAEKNKICKKKLVDPLGKYFSYKKRNNNMCIRHFT